MIKCGKKNNGTVHAEVNMETKVSRRKDETTSEAAVE